MRSIQRCLWLLLPVVLVACAGEPTAPELPTVRFEECELDATSTDPESPRVECGRVTVPELKEVLNRVQREPVRVDLPNPGTGELETVTLRYPELVTALRYVLYSVNLSAALPQQVLAAYNGDYAPMAGILSGVLPGLHNLLADGMWASVICTEEAPFIDIDQALGLSADTVLGSLRLDATLAICGFWPQGEIPRGFHDPVSSTVPVLLIAGEFDPASPLDLAEDAVRHLPNGALVTVANRSHWGLGNDPCIEGIVEQFLDAASVEGLDLSCAAAFERPPFALGQ